MYDIKELKKELKGKKIIYENTYVDSKGKKIVAKFYGLLVPEKRRKNISDDIELIMYKKENNKVYGSLIGMTSFEALEFINALSSVLLEREFNKVSIKNVKYNFCRSKKEKK